MTDEVRLPDLPASAQAFALAWMAAEADLPEGWWVSLNSEYGSSPVWIAFAEVSQFSGWDPLEATGATPEEALRMLGDAVRQAAIVPSHVDGVDVPLRARDASELAEAWSRATASLPPAWWIAQLDGYEGGKAPPGWIATANGGPEAGYDGRQGFGSDPASALRALAP